MKKMHGPYKNKKQLIIYGYGIYGTHIKNVYKRIMCCGLYQ